MKLTPKQNELIEEYKRLESKYGKLDVLFTVGKYMDYLNL